MLNSNYKLSYLPIFYYDLSEKVYYIAFEKKNPDAALKLVKTVEEAIKKRVPIAESFEPYHSRKDRKHPYYRIYIDNYIVYYVVIDDGNGSKTMEVRRLLSVRQNSKSIV